jgi:hypothetical protein
VNIALNSSTGIEQVNNILREVIGRFELSFPGRIRSYLLGGSYSDGSAVGYNRSPNSSDIDLFVIFRGTIKETEESAFHSVVEECQRLSPLALDAHAYSEDDLLQPPRPEATQTSFLTALIKGASLLVYGNDLRMELPAVPFSRYVLDVIESGVFHLGIPRQREALAYPLMTPLAPPLAYPDPEGEFYGYDAVPARPDAPRGTRVLVAITAWIATLILALETGRYAGQKTQSIRLCKEHLPNDHRAQLAATIYIACKGAWRYGLPEGKEGRERLRGWCQETLALENEYLRLCRGYILAQLQQGGTDEQRQAASILQSVIYRDKEIVSALTALAQPPPQMGSLDFRETPSERFGKQR